MIHLSTIAYADHEYLAKLIESALGCPLVSKIFIHDTSPYLDVHRRVEKFADTHRRVEFMRYGSNRGVSACWNDSIIGAVDEGLVPLLVNDDAWFSDGDIERMYETSLANTQSHIIVAGGLHLGFNKHLDSHGYSCFILNPIGVDKLGAFDQNYFPAYLEDCDYDYRAKRLGLSETVTLGTNVHHVGHGSIQTDPNLMLSNQVTHRKNFEYYRVKWGGINGEEVYEHPFNDSEVSMKIEFSNRNTPYGEGRDRDGKAKNVPLSFMSF